MYFVFCLYLLLYKNKLTNWNQKDDCKVMQRRENVVVYPLHVPNIYKFHFVPIQLCLKCHISAALSTPHSGLFTYIFSNINNPLKEKRMEHGERKRVWSESIKLSCATIMTSQYWMSWTGYEYSLYLRPPLTFTHCNRGQRSFETPITKSGHYTLKDVFDSSINLSCVCLRMLRQTRYLLFKYNGVSVIVTRMLFMFKWLMTDMASITWILCYNYHKTKFITTKWNISSLPSIHHYSVYLDVWMRRNYSLDNLILQAIVQWHCHLDEFSFWLITFLLL